MTRSFIVFLGTIFFSTICFSQHEFSQAPSPKEIYEVRAASSVNQELSATQRALKISERFLGKPYKGDVCGEGESGIYDKDPQSCFTSFDCTTYVEAVLALARSSGETETSCSADFWKNLRDIKYCDGSEPTFKNRNHFVEIQWCNNLNKKGYLKDVTVELFPEAPERRKWINTDTWIGDKISSIKANADLSDEEKEAQILELQKISPNFADKEQLGKLNYIPLSSLLAPEMQTKLKAETLLVFNLIKNEHSKTSKIPVMVSHQGFLINKDGVLFIRHASPSKGSEGVRDVPFNEYVKDRMGDAVWPTLGFNFQRLP